MLPDYLFVKHKNSYQETTIKTEYSNGTTLSTHNPLQLNSGVLGAYHQRGTFMPEKMALPKYRVRPICATKHITLRGEAKGDRGL